MQGDLIAVAVPHQPVQLLQVLHRLVQAAKVHPGAVDEGLLAEDDVAVAVVGDLVPLRQDAADQAVVVLRAALVVLVDVRIVVVLHAAPRGAAHLAGLVRIVLAGVPHHVKGPLGAELRQGVQQHVRQGLSAEAVRGGRQIHRAVVKGHGADPPVRLDPLDAAGIADIVLLRRLEHLLHDPISLFSDFNDQ